ncbi:40S ribosomal protein S19-1 [Durusdinium trenchii]|uniref:40S ribosomal protein S19-1 n=1 Tax=Durusdinium trenchii TaxID=1381693 RepID=A0ABP0PF00_9DINO
MSRTCRSKAARGRFELPKWADVVKTSKARELPPSDPDWLYVRTASMVRKIYIRKGMGVGAFRKVYGSQQRRGTCTNVFTKSSGKIARYILQQLEEMGLVEQDEEGGRMITKEGQRELDTVAVQAAEEEVWRPRWKANKGCALWSYPTCLFIYVLYLSLKTSLL